jgi:hypothetical protein
MAEVNSGGKPGDNIYTVLVLVSFLALLSGVLYVLYRGSQVFEGGFTWFIPQ